MFIEKKRTKFFALPFCFTTYTVTEDKITVKKGLFSTTEDECYIYKVQDVRLIKSFIERIFHLGTVVCYTGDTTDKELKLIHIRNSSPIKDYIMEQSEEARRKKRTLHTLGIDSDSDYDDLSE